MASTFTTRLIYLHPPALNSDDDFQKTRGLSIFMARVEKNELAGASDAAKTATFSSEFQVSRAAIQLLESLFKKSPDETKMAIQELLESENIEDSIKNKLRALLS